MEDSVKKAEIPNFYTCPHCPFGGILEPGDVEFICAKEGAGGCGKKTCTLCKEESHPGIKCEDVEKKVVTDARLVVEEAMTLALIRTCPNDKCEKNFFKTEGW